jgi:proteasome alpha subunit
MRGGDNRQAYDRGVSLWSPDGRIYQVEYAREAVKRGSPSVGIRVKDAVVLAAARRVHSELLEPRSIEKLHRVDDHHGVASAGHVADARQLVGVARRAAQVERLRYGEPITTDQLTTEISEHIQEYTQSGGTRPYGAALLAGGYDERPRLFETDPSGTPYEWTAKVVGGRSEQIQEHLEERYSEEMSVHETVALAADVLAEEEEEDAPENVAVSVVDADGYRLLSDDEVADAIADAE